MGAIMFRKFQITEIINRTTNVRSYRFDGPNDFLYLWKGLIARIGRTTIKKAVPDLLQSLFHICGPPRMVRSMRELLDEMEVPHKRILFEDFYGY